MEIALGILLIMGLLLFMKRQDNDELGKETFTPQQQVINNGGSNLGLLLGLAALVILVIMGVGAGGG